MRSRGDPPDPATNDAGTWQRAGVEESHSDSVSLRSAAVRYYGERNRPARFATNRHPEWDRQARQSTFDSPLMRQPINAELVRGYETGEIATAAALARRNLARPRFDGRFARRPYQRSADREKSIKRRRQLAASGCMPPTMACELTTSEQAVARIIVDEVVTHGRCELCLDAMAARAGVCSKTAQRALRRLGEGKGGAQVINGLNWLKVELRPVEGRKHLPNVVTIVSAQWLAWIERGPIRSRGIGGHLRPATVNVKESIRQTVDEQHSGNAVMARQRATTSQVFRRRTNE